MEIINNTEVANSVNEKPVDKFVHLHVHSHFSLLDGLSSPKDLVKTAKSLGFNSLAITDHGSCGGLFRFQKACKEAGIKPILGVEGYFCDDHTSKEGKIYHIILLAKNKDGMKNIMRLTTLSELKGKYKKPRIDMKLLREYHNGIICTSACCAGKIPDLLWNGNIDGAKNLALEFKSVFGDDFYIEVMKHKYFSSKKQEEREEQLVASLISLAKDIGVKVIATNDVHYSKKSDSKCHDVLLSMQTGNIIKNPDRFSFDSDEFYIKSYDEMYEMYKDYPEVLSNTVEVANKIENDELFKFGPDLLPDFNVPNGFKSEEDYLKAIVKDGMISYGLIDKPEYRERIKFEMQTILKCKYTRYFLILWDVINYAKNNDIAVGVGRGCFLPYNNVKCENGTKPIIDVNVGDKVLSYDKKYHDVIDKMEYDVNEEVIEIEVEDGRVIKCTLDHEIHVVRDGALVWVKACELKEGDDIYDI